MRMFCATVFAVYCPADFDKMGFPYLRLQVLHNVSVKASADREAAAKAWIKCVGQERGRRLQEENGSDAIRRLQTDLEGIQSLLVPTTLCPGSGYQFDDGNSVWFVNVQPSDLELDRSSSTEGPTEIDFSLQPSAADPSAILRSIRFPSLN